jgi:hypothetical protein
MLVVLVIAPAPLAAAAGLRFEAEDALTLGRVHNAGGDQDTVPKACSGASGGMAVEGLDFWGDWIEFDLELQAPFVFRDSVRCAALSGQSWCFRVSFFRDGESEPIAETDLPPVAGRGIG